MAGQKINKKVLVVDDEVSVRMFIKKALGKGYVVLEATNGEEAIGLAQNKKPDIILLDIMMPGIDGLSACHVIKENINTKNIPVIMLTGVGYELNRRLSIEVMGADGYITKPFRPNELRKVMTRCLK